MKCCTNCFDDQELTGFIISNSTERGDCDFCGSKNTEILDPREFEEKFLQLVQVYEFVGDPAPEDIKSTILHKKLQDQWGIFKESLEESTYEALLKAILADVYSVEGHEYSPPRVNSIPHLLSELSDSI